MQLFKVSFDYWLLKRVYVATLTYICELLTMA